MSLYMRRNVPRALAVRIFCNKYSAPNKNKSTCFSTVPLAHSGAYHRQRKKPTRHTIYLHSYGT